MKKQEFRKVMHHADEKIKLPITGKTQSLNVSVACGAILYETVRQKKWWERCSVVKKIFQKSS